MNDIFWIYIYTIFTIAYTRIGTQTAIQHNLVNMCIMLIYKRKAYMLVKERQQLYEQEKSMLTLGNCIDV